MKLHPYPHPFFFASLFLCLFTAIQLQVLASEKSGLEALTSQVALAAANLLKGFLATKASGSSVTAELIFSL